MTMKHYAVIGSDARVQSQVSVADDCEPPAFPGCSLVELLEPLVQPQAWACVDGALVPAEIPAPTTADLWAAVRRQRNALLAACDWTDTASAPARMGAAYQDWQAYRQALRDITNQPDPAAIAWPAPPTT